MTKGVQPHRGSAAAEQPGALQQHQGLSCTGGFRCPAVSASSLCSAGAAALQVEELGQGLPGCRAQPIKLQRREAPGPGWPRLGRGSGGGRGGRLGGPWRVREGQSPEGGKGCVSVQGLNFGMGELEREAGLWHSFAFIPLWSPWVSSAQIALRIQKTCSALKKRKKKKNLCGLV